ncbi:MAG: carbon storage regulator CsrA [Acidimicrobiales bacterium]
MLVLSRREGQSIVIGGNVVVTVVSVRGDHVRLGIEAPRSVAVHRQEVAVAIESANREALVSTDVDTSSLPMPAAEDPRSSAPTTR